MASGRRKERENNDPAHFQEKINLIGYSISFTIKLQSFLENERDPASFFNFFSTFV
jgi:hypothetical protein